MPEPGRLISFAVAGEEASNALLDALSLLSWSGNALVQHEDAEAEEAGPLLQKEADPINGMDFYAPAAVAGGRGGSRFGSSSSAPGRFSHLVVSIRLQVKQTAQKSQRMRPWH